ncbi:hypothetical protein [Kutzneria buriramensis]|nr:hypothetical protein [Kutzneria buriramensis]
MSGGSDEIEVQMNRAANGMIDPAVGQELIKTDTQSDQARVAA